ncbi:hypothetical protein VUR80DRAFT_6713 [Thermomyces stellatus]
MPPRFLSSQTYGTAKEWYSALVDMRMARPALQDKDAAEDDDNIKISGSSVF